MQPKREALAAANAELARTQTKLREMQDKVAKLNKQLKVHACLCSFYHSVCSIGLIYLMYLIIIFLISAPRETPTR